MEGGGRKEGGMFDGMEWKEGREYRSWMASLRWVLKDVGNVPDTPVAFNLLHNCE